MKCIYLDYAATTPLDPRVIENMNACFGIFGHASSQHSLGRVAAKRIEIVREQVAQTIGAVSQSIIFTSGATESNNLAILGIAEFHARRGKHIIACSSDHPSLVDPCRYLERKGYTVTYLKPQPNGLINLSELRASFREDTILVTLVWVNSETGVIQPAKAIVDIAHEKGVYCHFDAAQAVGKIPIDVNLLEVDLLSLSAHKIYGPKGIGALYIRQNPRVRLSPRLYGGGQEQGLRSGTLATHQIIGMGAAFELVYSLFDVDHEHVKQCRNLWLDRLKTIEVLLNSEIDLSVPHIVNLAFSKVDNHALQEALPSIACSTGSACTSGRLEPSYVLTAMGFSRARAAASLRFSFGRFTTLDEIEQATYAIISAIKQM